MIPSRFATASLTVLAPEATGCDDGSRSSAKHGSLSATEKTDHESGSRPRRDWAKYSQKLANDSLSHRSSHHSFANG